MRALRVLGLADGGEDSTVPDLVCEDAETGEQFAIACDDRLRAAARGDLSRFGQLEIELESQLRPKDIQARIRAGATVDQVAAIAGTSAIRVERFAYPVLLERASMAEKARKARPSIDGITAKASVEDTVAATLSSRGHDGEVSWDAFKEDRGWVLSLRWNAGRSENHAQWDFHPGADGGTLSARDDAAAEIVDPALRILRPLRPVRQDAVTSVLLDPTNPTAAPGRSADVAPRQGAGSRSVHPAGSKLPAVPPSRFPAPAARSAAGQNADAAQLVEQTVTDERAGVTPARAQVVRTGTDSSRSLPHTGARQTPAPSPTQSVGSDKTLTTPTTPVPAARPAPVTGSPASTARTDAGTPEVVRAPDARHTPAANGSPASRSAAQPTAPKGSKRSQRPAMPSWEDVLLGTRSNGQ